MHVRGTRHRYCAREWQTLSAPARDRGLDRARGPTRDHRRNGAARDAQHLRPARLHIQGRRVAASEAIVLAPGAWSLHPPRGTTRYLRQCRTTSRREVSMAGGTIDKAKGRAKEAA